MSVGVFASSHLEALAGDISKHLGEVHESSARGYFRRIILILVLVLFVELEYNLSLALFSLFCIFVLLSTQRCTWSFSHNKHFFGFGWARGWQFQLLVSYKMQNFIEKRVLLFRLTNGKFFAKIKLQLVSRDRSSFIWYIYVVSLTDINLSQALPVLEVSGWLLVYFERVTIFNLVCVGIGYNILIEKESE